MFVRFTTIVFICIFSFPVFTQDAKTEPTPKSDIDLSKKTPLSERELAKKKEGGYLTGIAGPGSSPDTGFGATAIMLYYYNGKKDDPLFPYTPYLHNIGALVTYMSRGFLQFGLLWDAPYFLRTPYRITVELWYTMNPVAQYYGVGTKTMQPLRHPDGTTYSRMEDYDDDLRQTSAGTTYSHYNYYDLKDTLGKLTIQRDFSGGLIRLLGGVNVDYFNIGDYSNKTVTVAKTGGARSKANMLTTRLKEDQLSGKILGFNGGWNNSILLGFSYDTRDLEPYPRTGMFHDILLMYTSKALGSQYDWTEATTALRFYYSPFPKFDMVLAGRLSYTARFGDIPFYGMTGIRYTDKSTTSMGGMRGYRDRRFMGPFIALANFETRIKFMQLKPGEQLFEFAIAPFIDLGRASDTMTGMTFEDWALSYGAGLRITWNQSTVFALDFGFSSEDFGFYMQVRQIF
ncbi:MAG: DUF5982 domain-containing protein [Leptospirales bacterium]